MNKSEFWHIVESAKAESGGDIDEQIEIIYTKLCKLDADEIVQYGTIFSEYFFQAYNWELWAAAYIINEGCGDDSFMDFRAGLISQGEEIFTKALADPESLIDVISFEDGKLSPQSDWAAGVEDMLYVDGYAYKTKTGSDDMPRTLPSQIDITGKKWEEGKEGKVLPKLAEYCRAGRIKTLKQKLAEPNPEQLILEFGNL